MNTRHRSTAPGPELAEARAAGLLNIGQAAQRSGLSAKRIRHYESIGLLPASARSFAGYRLYDGTDLHRLQFIRSARELGFSIEQIGTLLGLWQDPGRSSAEVKQLATAHADALQAKILELQAMQASLRALARSCRGDTRPQCPILEHLAAPEPARSSRGSTHANSSGSSASQSQPERSARRRPG